MSAEEEGSYCRAWCKGGSLSQVVPLHQMQNDAFDCYKMHEMLHFVLNLCQKVATAATMVMLEGKGNGAGETQIQRWGRVQKNDLKLMRLDTKSTTDTFSDW
ncbi:hypothetical protein Nepgr_020527 [Nepenthes gracilis]|uniref:Uncharacterized protein n=1 Tax=Nepenthes gracilis TaxID=150966 RepID=A0AAD3SXG5_NEPGR|nr:hypothetical protein Nepgr_020527 [Nepenthes gracilis]